MRSVLRTLGLPSALLLACACAAQRPPENDSVAAAEALDRRFLEAFNRGDLDALMATYWKSPELVSFGLDGMGTHGWEATRASWAEGLKSMPGGKLEFTRSHHTVVGDAVLGWGTWKITIPVPNGASAVIEGRYSDVKAERDGAWVYVLDHASVPMPSEHP